MGNKRNQVRIIAGQWRGRKISFPDIEGLRPTTDPIRETVFSWLQLYLLEARCLDLFAGSGALGFEAASRGAKSVDLVEQSTQVARTLKQSKEELSADNVAVHAMDANAFLSGLVGQEKQYDIIFLDPPFHRNLIQPSIDWIEKTQCLADDGMVYIESGPRLMLDFLPPQWVEHKQKKRGQVLYRLYRRESE